MYFHVQKKKTKTKNIRIISSGNLEKKKTKHPDNKTTSILQSYSVNGGIEIIISK